MEYYDTLNNFIKNDVILEMEEYAYLNKVPIITKDGLNCLLCLIKISNSKKILEIGTAIAYSSSMMALQDNTCFIDTIERNEDMYRKAGLDPRDENTAANYRWLLGIK